MRVICFGLVLLYATSTGCRREGSGLKTLPEATETQSSQATDSSIDESPNREDFEEVVRLKSFSVKDMKLPLVLSKAQVYAVVSYFDRSCNPVTDLIELPGIEKPKVEYKPGTILHHWSKNNYQVVNVAFFRHGTKYDYKKILNAFAAAASGIYACSIASENATTAIAVGKILYNLSTNIIESIPSELMVDGERLLDTFNVLEKDELDGKSIIGTQNNATAGFSLFKLKRNPDKTSTP